MYKRLIIICCLLSVYSQNSSASLKEWGKSYPTGYNIAYVHAKAGIIGLAGYAYLKTFLPYMLETDWEEIFPFLPSWQGLKNCVYDITRPEPFFHISAALALMYGIYHLINQTEGERIYASSDDVSKLKAYGSLVATLLSGLILNRLFNVAAQ